MDQLQVAPNIRRRTNVSAARRKSTCVLRSAEVIENLRKIDELRQREEERKEKEAAMQAYFDKEESRRNELVKWIHLGEEVNNKISIRRLHTAKTVDGGFFCVHVLLRYQEIMLCEGYVAPTSRRYNPHYSNDE